MVMQNRLWYFNTAIDCSRKAALVNSQGRKPLVS